MKNIILTSVLSFFMVCAINAQTPTKGSGDVYFNTWAELDAYTPVATGTCCSERAVVLATGHTYYWDRVTAGWLRDTKWDNGSGIPTLAPAAGQGANLYMDTTGIYYRWNGSAWFNGQKENIEDITSTMIVGGFGITETYNDVAGKDTMAIDSTALVDSLAVSWEQNMTINIDTIFLSSPFGTPDTILVAAAADTYSIIQVDGAVQSTSAPTLDFDGTDFLLTESPADDFDITIVDSGIDHDATTNFVANEHIDHTTVTLTAGNGISGGGDISSNRTFDLDFTELATETTLDATDYIIIRDETPTANDGKILLSNFETQLTITESQISDLVHTTNTNLSQEEVEDFAFDAARHGTGTQTLITVTYDDASNNVDYVVNSSLAAFTDDLAHVEESTTVSDGVGFDLTLSTYDIGFALDMMELTSEATPDVLDSLWIWDTDQNTNDRIAIGDLPSTSAGYRGDGGGILTDTYYPIYDAAGDTLKDGNMYYDGTFNQTNGDPIYINHDDTYGLYLDATGYSNIRYLYGGAWRYDMGTNSNGNKFIFGARNTGFQSFNFTGANVGIETSNPLGKFHMTQDDETATAAINISTEVNPSILNQIWGDTNRLVFSRDGYRILEIDSFTVDVQGTIDLLVDNLDSKDYLYSDVDTIKGGSWATSATFGNLVFDTDNTVGAGQDNFVLTYDDALGTIQLEAVPAGGSESTTVTDAVNGLDIGEIGDDITIAFDPSEMGTQAPDLADILLIEDVTDGGIHGLTLTQLQTAVDTDTDTQLSQEQVEDFSFDAARHGTGTQTLITVTYDDASNNVDYVVENDLSLYDNATSGFINSTAGNWTGTFDGQEGTYYLDYTNFTNKPTLLSQFTDDLSHVEESTTVNDQANGLDIVLTTYDLSIGFDPSETVNQAPDLADLLLYEDITDGNSHNMTLTQLQTLIAIGDGDGIYTASGTIPTSVVATVTDNFTLQNSTATGDIPQLIIDNNSTGDAAIKFEFDASPDRWIMGVDNSDGEKFKILKQNDFSDVGTTDGFILDNNLFTFTSAGSGSPYFWASITSFEAVNYSFEVNQSVGAGTDNYVLTYDDGDGLISLEPAAGGADGDGIYDASGTIPTNVVATVTDDFSLLQSSAQLTAQLLIDQNSTGDANIGMSVGASNWSMGVDNSDGDAFKISAGTTVDAFTRIKIDGAGTFVELHNYQFDTDQTVGAGTDNYALVYDDGDGQISLESFPAGEATTVTDNADGIDIGEIGDDITVSIDISELVTQAADLADLMIYEDVTDGGHHDMTFTSLQTLIADGTGTDDQQIDNFSIAANILSLEIEDDGQAAQTVDLSGYLDNTDTQLTEEQVEDFVGGMLGGTETLITVTYQDGTNDIDFVVDNDLANYSNATSAFITAGDLDGDGIYDGSGTVPTTTVVTLTDNINFGSELFIDGTGVHIGSGTTAGATLDIEDVGTQDLFKAANRFRITDSGIVDWGASAGSYGFLSWDTGKALIGARSGVDLVFPNDAGEAMRLLSNGDLLVDNLNTSDFLYSEVDTIKGGSWSGVNLSEFNDDIGAASLWTDGGAETTLTSTSDDLRLDNNSSHARFYIDADAAFNPNLYLAEAGVNKWIIYNDNTTDILHIADGAAGDAIQVEPDYDLILEGNVLMTGTKDFVVGSEGVAFFNTQGGAWIYVETAGINLGDFTTPTPTYGEIAVGTYNFAIMKDDDSDLFSINNTTGKTRLHTYGSATHTGTATYLLGVDANGYIIEEALGGGDGDGVYDGNGTIPSNTVATLGNNINFQKAGGNDQHHIKLESTSTGDAAILFGTGLIIEQNWIIGQDYSAGDDFAFSTGTSFVNPAVRISHDNDFVDLGTLRFDTDNTVGAGQDDMVLTYDDALGTIQLEAAAGGSSLWTDGTTASYLTTASELVTIGSGADEGNYTLNLYDTNGLGATGMHMANTDSGKTSTDGFLVSINGTEQAELRNYENTNMTFLTNNVTALTIEADGDLVIADGFLSIEEGSTTGTHLSMYNSFTGNTGSDGLQFTSGNGSFNIHLEEAATLSFGTNSVDALKIFTGGNIELSDYGSGNNTGTATYWLAVDASGDIIEEAAPSGGGGQAHETIVIDNPGVWESFVWIAPDALTLEKVTAVMEGGTSLDFNIKHGTNRTTGTANMFTADKQVTSTTTIDVFTATISDATVAADEIIILDVNAVVGAPTEIVITIEYSYD